MAGEYEILGYDDDDLMGDDFDDEGLQGYDELLGDDDDDYDLMGDDDEDDDLLGDLEILGRRRRRRRRGRSRSRRRRPKARRRVARRAYSRDRGLILGFGTQAGIAAGATVDFTANPQVPFRPKRVLIDTDATPIEVADIKVGKNSQLASAGGFPASGFQANAFDIGVKFDSAYPGLDIVTTITNNAVGAATVTVGMFGYAAER